MPPIAQYVYDSLVQISLIRTRTRRFSTREIAETLSAMAKSGSSNAVLQLALFELAAEKVITITPQDIAMTLHAASRLELPAAALERCFVENLGPHMAKVVHTFNPQDLSMCLLAIALLQLPIERVVGLLPGPCSPLSSPQILALLCARVPAADARITDNILSSCATLGLFQAAAGVAPKFKPQELTCTLRAASLLVVSVVAKQAACQAAFTHPPFSLSGLRKHRLLSRDIDGRLKQSKYFSRR
jgi:hypothetical protein